MIIRNVITEIEKGAADGPYSPQLGNTSRSLESVWEKVGITTPKVQRQALADLLKAGHVVKAKWNVPGKGNETLTGLRSLNRLPYQWEWCDADEE